MGREWYWVGSRSSKRGGNGDGTTTTTSTTTSTTPSGCMSAVFHFFDFHPFQFHLHQQQPSFKPNSFLPVETCISKGVEAPRNSLELEETPLPSTPTKDEDKLNIQMGIQIKTSGDTRSKVGASNNDSSSEISSSPGTKTPNLVARLMGLDLLPECHSPSCSSSSIATPTLQAKSHLHPQFRPRQSLQSKPISHKNYMDSDFTGTRSLPETPRISSARRSDVDHRLSLQIYKENISVSEELEFSRFSSLRRKELRREDENKSPSHYARQIVKQVKESVSSRKVGLDITNTIKTKERNELVSQFKSKKNVKVLTKVADESSPGKQYSTLSCSPRLRFLDTKNKTNILTSTTKVHAPHQSPKPSLSSSSSHVNIQPQPIKVSPKPKLKPLPTVPEQQQQEDHKQRPIKRCKKAANERFGPAKLKKPPQTSDIMIRNKQEEPFVRAPTTCRATFPDKKCKKTPLSSDLINITVPTLLTLKKDPSPPPTKIQITDVQESKLSSQLSSSPSQMYKQEVTHELVARDNNEERCNGATNNNTTTGEYEYVTKILKRTGIDNDTQVSFTRWFSPSHPLDPSIFYYIEHFTTVTSKNDVGQLGLLCNRKLLFHLVNEILVGILKPYINMKPWVSTFKCDYSHMQGSELIDTLCLKIRSFPCANCHVLEDIDALIDKDLPQLKQQSGMAFEEEGEGIVADIERDIIDTLIHEMVVLIHGRSETVPFVGE